MIIDEHLPYISNFNPRRTGATKHRVKKINIKRLNE